jgi:hypothetical protein
VKSDRDLDEHKAPREPGDKPESERKSDSVSAPRRVIPLRDLAGRANACGSASQQNQMAVSQHLVPVEEKLHQAVLGGAQLIASAIFHCTLAICERLDDRDAPALTQEIDQNVLNENGKLN